MKRIDFYEKKKALHNEMLEAIVALFSKGGFDEIDLCPEGEWQQNAYVILSPDGAESTYERQVKKVKVEDDEVFVTLIDHEWWISCEHAGMVVTDSLETLYDAVYDWVGDLNFVYYVCELDENGKPTGNVNKEKWRLGYAENMMEERGFIFNDYETALLHAQYGDQF